MSIAVLFFRQSLFFHTSVHRSRKSGISNKIANFVLVLISFFIFLFFAFFFIFCPSNWHQGVFTISAKPIDLFWINGNLLFIFDSVLFPSCTYISEYIYIYIFIKNMKEYYTKQKVRTILFNYTEITLFC